MVSSNLFTSFSKRPITLQKHSSGFRILSQLRGLLSLNSVRSQYPFKRLFVHWMKLRKAGRLRYSVARLMHNSNMFFYLKLSYSSLVTLIAQKRFHMIRRDLELITHDYAPCDVVLLILSQVHRTIAWYWMFLLVRTVGHRERRRIWIPIRSRHRCCSITARR